MKEFSLGVLVTAVTRTIVAREQELCDFYHHMLGDNADMKKHKLLYETVKAKIIATFPEFENIKIDRPVNSEEEAYRFLSTLLAAGYKMSYEIDPL